MYTVLYTSLMELTVLLMLCSLLLTAAVLLLSWLILVVSKLNTHSILSVLAIQTADTPIDSIAKTCLSNNSGENSVNVWDNVMVIMSD